MWKHRVRQVKIRTETQKARVRAQRINTVIGIHFHDGKFSLLCRFL
jgi:hypothetical protein